MLAHRHCPRCQTILDELVLNELCALCVAKDRQNIEPPLGDAEQFLTQPSHRASLALLAIIPVSDTLTAKIAARVLREDGRFLGMYPSRIRRMLSVLGRWFTVGHCGGVIYWRRTADEVAMVERVLDKVASDG